MTKIKLFYADVNNEIIFSIIIVLVGVIGFSLGRISVLGDVHEQMRITSGNVLSVSNIAAKEYRHNIQNNISGRDNTYNNGDNKSANDTMLHSKNIKGTVVVSKKGKKYHYPWCSGAQRMSEKNKRWFESIKEARDAGYLPAKNCKGLE